MEPVDQEYIQQLKEIMGDDFSTLITTYLTDTRQRLNEIESSYRVQDFESLNRNLHTLKGSSDNVGAKEMACICAQLERVDETSAAVESEIKHLADCFLLVEKDFSQRIH